MIGLVKIGKIGGIIWMIGLFFGQVYAQEADTISNVLSRDYDRHIVVDYLNGAASEAMPMMKLMMQVIVILIVGIMLWRISAIFNRKKQNRRQDMFADSRFQKHWRKK